VAAVPAAFPKGNPYVALRAEFGALYDDQLFADVYPSAGRPADVAPGRLALVMVMPYIAGVTERQAAAAVRRSLDWKYALSLDWMAPGCDFGLWHDVRHRWLAQEAGQRCLDTCLAACNARGWLTARGTPRTAATQVSAAIRTLHRWECGLEAMHEALNQRSEAAPTWVRQQVPPAWYTRDGLRSDQARLPKDASKREPLARQSAADGDQLLDWVRAADPALGLGELPALEPLRRMWLQPDDRCTVPGLEAPRWRTGDEPPPAAVRSASPHDLEARAGRQREMHGVGCTVHLPDTGAAAPPDLRPLVRTTAATTHDRVMGPAIQHD
jgi:transposase